MKVLVACEESQAVCIEFRKLGHEAYSCDIQECSGAYPEYHIQGDVIPLLNGNCKFTTVDCMLHIIENQWDLIIAHPPCTYLANAGLHYLKTRPERQKELNNAFEFVKRIWEADCKRICIENPVGWLNTHWRKPDMIVNPYNFGTPERKQTCFWLKGLPKLDCDIDAKPPEPRVWYIRKTGSKKGQRYGAYWRENKSAKQRSKTFPCIAKAMAEQWGCPNALDKYIGFEETQLDMFNNDIMPVKEIA